MVARHVMISVTSRVRSLELTSSCWVKMPSALARFNKYTVIVKTKNGEN